MSKEGETRWDSGMQRFVTVLDVHPGAVTLREATHHEIRRLVDVDDVRLNHETYGPLLISTTIRYGGVAHQAIRLRKSWWAFWRWDS